MTTAHSLVRAKERIGLSSDKAEAFIEKALTQGKRYLDFHTAAERNWLKKQNNPGSYALAYDKYCFIINDDQACITLYKLPTWFGNHKHKHYAGKEQIRHLAKYLRFHDVWEDTFEVC